MSDIPIIVLEAMALGKPVVASNLEGVKEAIKDGQNGLIVDISNPIKLAESINYLLDNPAFCRKIGSEAAISAKEYSSSEISKKLSNIYLNIME